MRNLVAALFGLGCLPAAPAVRAQSKTITGETVTVTATVEAIEASTRTLTLKGPKGNYVDIVAPDTVTASPRSRSATRSRRATTRTSCCA